MGRGVLIGLVTAAAASALAAPAAAQTRGAESFTTVTVATGASGERQVVSSTVIAQGVFTGVGRSDGEDLVFAAGTVHLARGDESTSFSFDPRTCVFNRVERREGAFAGGTGTFASAAGTYLETVQSWGTLSRAPDGSCAPDAPPLQEVDFGRAAGTLSY